MARGGLAAAAIAASLAETSAIFGGVVSTARDYPEYVSFLGVGRWDDQPIIYNLCGGTLVGDRWVMTARDCQLAYDMEYKPPFIARQSLFTVGVAIDDEGFFNRTIPIRNWMMCPDSEYHGNPAAERMDCVLIELAESALPYGAVAAPMYRGPKPVGEEVTLVGRDPWDRCPPAARGDDEVCRLPETLREARTVVVEDSACELEAKNGVAKYGVFNGTRSICVGDASVERRARGLDQGGPLFIKNNVTGSNLYLGTISGPVFMDTFANEKNFTISLYSDFIADWAMKTMAKRGRRPPVF